MGRAPAPLIGYRAVDADELTTLVRPTGIDPIAAQRWEADIAAGDMTLLVAYDGNEPIGRVNIIWKSFDEAEPVAELGIVPVINALQLRREYTGKGIGKQIMLACEDEVRTRPDQPQLLALGVEPDNVVARNLYEKLGYRYQELAGEQTYLTSWEETTPDGVKYVEVPAMLMVKEL